MVFFGDFQGRMQEYIVLTSFCDVVVPHSKTHALPTPGRLACWPEGWDDRSKGEKRKGVDEGGGESGGMTEQENVEEG